MKARNLSDKKKQIKRWIVPVGKKERLLFAATSPSERDAKLILKILSKLNEHFTVSLRNNGAFDLHHTKEGKIKNHIPLVKDRINLTKLRGALEEFRQDMVKRIENPIKMTDESLQQRVFK